MYIKNRQKRTVTIVHQGKSVTYDHAGFGFEYLDELLHHPNQPISCGNLRQLFQIDPNQTSSDDFNETVPNADYLALKFPFLPTERPIEYADEQTIKEVKERMIELINEEAELMQYHDYARLDSVRKEKDDLIDYLKQVLSPMQKPRFLYHQQRNDYSAVKQAIKRALEKIKNDFPVLYIDLETHLKYGLLICYQKVS